MMAARRPPAHLIERLPQARGRLVADAPLGAQSWFRVGGPAEVLFRPADAEDLAQFLAACPEDVPVTVIGAASNLLIRDGGVPGVVIRLARGFTEVTPGDGTFRVGAGTLDRTVALHAEAEARAGLAFLSGIPGSIGGAFRTNAGAHGRELADVLVEAEVVDRSGIRTVGAEWFGLAYRHSEFPADAIVTAATLKAPPGDRATIAAELDAVRQAREAAQPIGARTGGSTFANPPGHKAWQLIEQAGCRGLRHGQAQVSEKHCNFLIASDGATAADIEALGETVRRRVLATSGVTLHWEIRRVGEP